MGDRTKPGRKHTPATRSHSGESAAGAAPAVAREHNATAMFPGSGEMSSRMRAFDWSSTTLGEVSAWPQSLRTAVDICLASRVPMVMYWGPDYRVLYNDAYSEILARKHPSALGRSARTVWAEIWDVIGPMLDSVVATGQSTLSEDLLLFLERFGYAEECYFSFSFSPVRVEDGTVGGVFCAVRETTERVIGGRRLRTLRDLAARTAETRTVAEACGRSAEVLAENLADVPFALIYLLEKDSTATLAGAAGLERRDRLRCPSIDLTGNEVAWEIDIVARTGRAHTVRTRPRRGPRLPAGKWSATPDIVQVLPLGQDRPVGVLVAAVNPHRKLDDPYQTFFTLMASQVSSAIADARAHEEERQRAEALAELDKAKTAFFSNVSHEFRTPLTLMLGPIADLLRRPGITTEESRKDLELVQRNGMRLLKLVNTLLDFSRIEAKRARIYREPTDLAALTADLASGFRSVMERAGLRLTVDCPPLGEPVLVDRELWEKIVLNLLSNALKFTLEGEVKVILKKAGDWIDLSVEDTGIGIEQSQLAHVFERFHRIEGAQGRSQEGSGIGLALVQDLARLHGGSVKVESEIGKGSTFTVSIPVACENLQTATAGRSDRNRLHDSGTRPYVEEALGWLSDADGPSDSSTPAGAGAAPQQPARTEQAAARILLADDNADLREYLRRLLSQEYEVEAVPDGEAALAIVKKNPPDLLLTDVMIPRLDGCSLLHAIRSDPEINNLPVILLSARAGEEAGVEALRAGANDYLTKPFSSSELLARVAARLEISRLRKAASASEHQLRLEAEAERQRLRELIAQAPTLIAVTRGPDHILELVNPKFIEAVGHTEQDLIGQPFSRALPELGGQEYQRILDDVYRIGQPHADSEALLQVNSRRGADRQNRYFSYVAQPLRGARGIAGTIFHAVDVTEQVLARKRVEESERQIRTLADSIPQLAWMTEPNGNVLWSNQQWYRFTGMEPAQSEGWGWQAAHDPEILPLVLQRWKESLRSGSDFEMEYPLRGTDGAFHWFLTRIIPFRDSGGNILRWFGTSTDVTELKRIQDERTLLLVREQEARATAELLNQVGPTLLGQLELNKLVQSVTDLAAAAIGAEFGAFVHDSSSPGGESASRYILSGPSPEVFESFPMPQSAELFEPALQAEGIIRSDDVQNDSRCAAFPQAAGAGFRSYLAALVVSRSGEVLGRMLFGHSAPVRFTRRHLAIIAGIAAQAAIAIDNARLFERAQQVQKDLQRSNDDLRRANKDMETFTYSASHDLEEPLRNISIYAQLLKRDYGGELPELAAQLLEGVRSGVSRMETLVKDLLAYSRVTKLLESPAPAVNAGSVLNEVLYILKTRIEESQATVTADELPVVAMHRSHLSLLLQNLVGNALKYRKQEPPIIHISAAKSDDSWVLTVTDNGIGIDPKYRTQIFGLFRRLHSRDKYPGSGVGLAICQRIVEQYGGRIWVEAAPGGGSIFLFSVRNAAAT
ncbi:MAG TPA: ATP-binding protein [Bryobacteraceae bacterium]|nr:ATP-binding protein [Bryobacteraceae bacterium]